MVKKLKPLQGTFLFRKKSAVLVEFSDEKGNPHRYSLPAESVTIESDGSTVFISEDDLDQLGIPYGIPWEHLLEEIYISSEQLANNLRKNGIWTSEDAVKNPDGIKSALISSTSLSISMIVKIAKEHLSKER